MTLGEALPFLVPLVLLQLVLLVFGIYDLTRPERRVKGDNKWIWALIIVIGQIPGTLIYFMLGREDT